MRLLERAGLGTKRKKGGEELCTSLKKADQTNVEGKLQEISPNTTKNRVENFLKSSRMPKVFEWTEAPNLTNLHGPESKQIGNEV